MLSITTNWPASTVFRAPVTISRAFSGYCAQIFPNSETCRYCSVPERIEVETRIEELLPKVSVSALSCTAGHGRPHALVELVVGELDLVAEDHLGVVELVGDDAGPGVRREHAGIEIDQAAERGEAELAGLEDDVGGVELVEQLQLRASSAGTGSPARPCR